MLSTLITSPVRARHILRSATAALALFSFGCADEGLEPEADAVQQDDDLALIAPINQQATAPDPNAPFFASVTANGTGCPKGSWTTDISSDGLTFNTNFSAYVARVVDGTRTSFKDCNLTIKLHSPSGISYAVSEFVYQGNVGIEEGISAFQTANYYFQGNPVPSADKEKRTDLTGPVFRSYMFQDKVTTADMVWSPCGLDRNLQVVTRVGLQKKQNIGEGEISLSSVDGQVRGKVLVKLAFKKCSSSSSSSGSGRR